MSGAIRSRVERHAQALEDAAAAMAADGIGLHSTRGHSVYLKRMAESMRADAAQGRLPHAWHDTAGMYAAASGPVEPALPAPVLRTLQACGVDLAAKDTTISVADLDVSMTAAGIGTPEKIAAKFELARLGRLT
jgi:hypothetical protein